MLSQLDRFRLKGAFVLSGESREKLVKKVNYFKTKKFVSLGPITKEVFDGEVVYLQSVKQIGGMK